MEVYLMEARAERTAAWHARMRGQITQRELYSIVGELRRRFGNRLYDKDR